MKRFGRIALLLLMIILAVPYIVDKNYFGPLDYMNLPFHEAGHFVFGFFGQFMGILGGTLGQLILPLAFLTCFLIRKDYTAATFSGFWLSENFVNIARYMYDAQYQALPLFGGEIHDWVYLFAEWKCITKAEAIAGFFRALGILGMLAAITVLLLSVIFRNSYRSSLSQQP